MWLHLLICNSAYHVTFSSSTSLYVGICYYVTGMQADFAQLLATIDKSIKKPNKPLKSAELRQNAAVVKSSLRDAILIHSKLSEWVAFSNVYFDYDKATVLPKIGPFYYHRLNDRIAELMSDIIFIMLFSCVIYFSICLFSLDQVDEIDSTFRIRITAPLPILFVTCLYCYFSEMITEKSAAVAQTTFDSMWYKLAMNQQKAIIPILVRSQREFRLQGLGIIDCSFPIYLAVMSHTLRYFILTSSTYCEYNFSTFFHFRLYEHRFRTFWFFAPSEVELAWNVVLTYSTLLYSGKNVTFFLLLPHLLLFRCVLRTFVISTMFFRKYFFRWSLF